MRLDEIDFIAKRTTDEIKEIRKKRGLLVKKTYTKSRKQPKADTTTFVFYNPECIGQNKRMKIGFTENRIYFFPSNDVYDYLLTKIHKGYNDYKISLSGKNHDIACKFIREKGYEFKYDEECKGWYVEKEDSENAQCNI